jgi:hypothetical protein
MIGSNDGEVAPGRSRGVKELWVCVLVWGQSAADARDVSCS